MEREKTLLFVCVLTGLQLYTYFYSSLYLALGYGGGVTTRVTASIEGILVAAILGSWILHATLESSPPGVCLAVPPLRGGKIMVVMGRRVGTGLYLQ